MPAYASPAGLVELPLRGSFLRAAPADCARGGIPLQTPLAHVPADPRLPKPMTHTRPRGIHAPTRSFGIIQTMLSALANFGLERMGRKNISGLCRHIFLGTLRA